jgi:thermitase
MAAGPPKAEQEPHDGADDLASVRRQAPLPLWRGFPPASPAIARRGDKNAMMTKTTLPKELHGERIHGKIRFALCLVVSGLLVWTLLAWTSPAAGMASRPAPGGHVPGEILVGFRQGTTLTEIAQLNVAHGASVIDAIPQIRVARVRLPAGSDEGQAAAAYQRNPHVQYAEPNYVATVVSTPNDPYFTGGFQWSMAKVQAPSAWDITTGSASVTVAILDTGVDSSHPDLQGKVVASVNFSDSATVTDVNGHGTHLAGIVGAATNNGQGVAGLGYNTAVMNVKVMGDNGTGGYGWVAQGVVWAADHGAKVINMSLGAQFGSSTLEDAINYAWNKGVVIVAAAGNDASSTPFYPAAYPNVIAVASTDYNDHLAPSSDYGDWVDVAAPGGNIYSTLPNNRYASLSGTSVASPHVAGLAALVFTRVTDSDADGLLNDEVRTCIENNADNIGIAGIGGGRINAYRAVQCSSSAPLPSPTPMATATPPPAPTATATPPPAPTATATPPSVPTATATPPSAGDKTAPQVTLQQPGQSQTVKGSVSVKASASDNVRVAKVSFFVDGVLYKTDTSAPYTVSWQSRKWSNGPHAVSARAFDAAGNTSEDTHTVTVQN